MPSKPIKVIFLDRDGVVNKEVGYLHKIADFEFIDGVFESCLYFQNRGYQIIIMTNQSGIGRGYYTVAEFEKLTQWMLSRFRAKGIDILDVYYCPHAPEDECSCRKPKPGMLLNAKQKHHIDMANSWIIGDKEADIQAANLANIKNTILVKSGHKINALNTKADFVLASVRQSIDLIK